MRGWMGPGHNVERLSMHAAVRFCANGSEHRFRVARPPYRDGRCRTGGAPEDPNVVGRRFGRRIRDLARLPAIGLHGLRHTHATLLL